MAAANAGGAGGASLGGFIIPIAFLVIFYVFAIRPQKKREKQIREMRESLRVGDEVITIGGIYGKIVKLKDDMVTIEVGANKTKMDLTRWAIGSTVNKQEVKENGEEK
ncbi:preprotein translocase subunit YajC [Clostridium sp. Cult2]|uniref:preprotein translocase subunit YajC n=1 Tax=Clostridium sp. Cult2 TaxID=2079003 RepID=UPI001F02E28C|nr:preprotein translocase subunit YajC [Clostridium sp. Cult2]MCF6465914.1 preprotein translocase subunit YajC [Clostridium sp. Cult2]